jgi:hypothetical protein
LSLRVFIAGGKFSTANSRWLLSGWRDTTHFALSFRYALGVKEAKDRNGAGKTIF